MATPYLPADTSVHLQAARRVQIAPRSVLTPRLGESEAVAVHQWDVDLLITAPDAWLAQVDLVLQSCTEANRRARVLGC